MKHELKITKDNYREVVLKRAIIICWVLLAICLVIKIFGGNFFNIVCNDENFIKFCNYCDTSFVRYVIYFTYFMFESIFFALILKPNTKIKDKRLVVYIFLCILFWVVKILVENQTIKISIPIFSVISIIILYLLLLIFSKNPLKSIYVILYQFCMVFASSLIKSISFTEMLSDSFLLYFIFNIDYYILLIITFLYRKLKFKKEK